MTRISRSIWNLAIPCILGNVSVPLLGLADVAIAGHLDNTASIGAISIGATLFNTLYWTMGFLRMGCSGLTAQAVGKKDDRAIADTLHRGLLLALAAGILFIVLSPIIQRGAFFLMRPTDEVASGASLYFSTLIFGAPAVLIQYSLTGWLIGNQDTRTPLLITLFQNIGNIILSLLLVLVFDMGLKGVAIGSLTAQWAGAILNLILLWRNHSRHIRDVRLSSILQRSGLIRFFRVNRDIFLRTLCMILVTLFFTTASSWQGEQILAANSLMMQMFLLFSYLMDGLAYSSEALVGKAIGAGDEKGFREVTVALIRYTLISMALFFMLFLLFGQGILSLLTDQEEVLIAVRPFLMWGALIPVCSGMAFLLDGVFIGATESGRMLQSVFLATLAFFAVFMTLRSGMGNHAIWLAFDLYLLLRSLIQSMMLGKVHQAAFKCS